MVFTTLCGGIEMSELMVMDNLPLETLAELANESARACEESGRKTVEHAIRCGRALMAAKAQVKHGEWLPWLEANFQHSSQWGQRFMQLAEANANRGLHLDEATSVKEAMRLLAETPEAVAKREARKTTKAIVAAQPQLQEPKPEQPEPTSEPLSQPCAPRDTRDPDDPPPLPKTNTRHTPANRQQIDRGADQPALPRLREGQVYIVRGGKLQEATAWDCAEAGFGEEELLDAMIESTTSAAVFARIMRRKAAEIDPHGEAAKPEPKQKAGKVPTPDQLGDAAAVMITNDPSLLQMVYSWATYKQSLSADGRVKSMQSWQTAVKRIVKVAGERGSVHVCDLIERAIANGYQGWEHDYSNGKQQSKTEACRVRSGRNWGDLPVYDLDGGLVSGKPD
jgi:hypothetical protein